MYHQTDDEEHVLAGNFSSTASSSQSGQQPVAAAYWTAPDNGRFVARLSTDDAYAVWGAQVLLHPHRSVETLVGLNLAEGVNIVGHATTTSPFDWSEVEALHLHARAGAVEASVDQLLNGAWVKGASRVHHAGETNAVYPYPDVEVGRINIVNTPVFSLDVHLESFADHNQVDAPSYLPENLDVDNTSWPVLNLTETTSGQLTLAVHDTTDTYRLVVDGWEDSIHFVQFVVDGPIEGLELQLWDMDQATSETLSTDITQPVGNQLKIGLQVGRGTHFLQIRFQNASEATPHLWGEDVEPRTYVLQASYSLIDEGEEPWFPPSDDAVYWGNIARWFMGILFLLPVVYLIIHVQRSKSYAASVAEKKQRLAWYTSAWTAERATSSKPEPTWPKRSTPLPNLSGKTVLRRGARSDWNTEQKTWPSPYGVPTNDLRPRKALGLSWLAFTSSTAHGTWLHFALTPRRGGLRSRPC